MCTASVKDIDICFIPSVYCSLEASAGKSGTEKSSVRDSVTCDTQDIFLYQCPLETDKIFACINVHL